MKNNKTIGYKFSSPAGVFFISSLTRLKHNGAVNFRPLTGSFLFHLEDSEKYGAIVQFPSPAGVFLISSGQYDLLEDLPDWFPSPAGVFFISS